MPRLIQAKKVAGTKEEEPGRLEVEPIGTDLLARDIRSCRNQLEDFLLQDWEEMKNLFSSLTRDVQENRAAIWKLAKQEEAKEEERWACMDDLHDRLIKIEEAPPKPCTI